MSPHPVEREDIVLKEMIKRGGEMTVQEIKDATGLKSRAMVGAALGSLKKKNLVRRLSGGGVRFEAIGKTN